MIFYCINLKNSNIVRRIDVVPATRLQHLDLSFDGASTSSGSGSGGSMTGLTSSNSTPVPYPKSKSTSSLEENVIATSGSVNLVNVQLNLSSTSSTGSSSNLMLGERTLSGSLLNPYHHVGSGGGASGTGPCGGFSTQYAWMCDLHGLPYREEVAWVRSYFLLLNCF